VPARALRALLGPAVLVALSAATPSAAAAWRPDVRAAARYAHTRAGQVSFAVRTEHRVWGYRRTWAVRSASVVKALLLVAYLDDPRVRDRPLTARDRQLIDPMIRRSDNKAANRVLAFVGADRVRRAAARAGMRRFRLNPVFWGGSTIDASDQTRFFLHYDAHVVARHRATAMHLLRTIVPEQRWGIGQVRPDGWRLYFKGGWGAGTGLVDHQVALLTHGRDRVSVAVLTIGSPNHAYGKQTLRGVFARLLRGLALRPVLTPL
jgi:Beta-lactamase enzyme family